MTILLLRHAHAGDRRQWDGPDGHRPLSDRGHDQARRIVDLYREHPIEQILSSPLTRCRQTVEPLAAARGLPIEEVDALAEGAALESVRSLLRRLGGTSAVLCSHGDVIGMLLTDLHHRGVLRGELEWKKASTWMLDHGADVTVATPLAQGV